MFHSELEINEQRDNQELERLKYLSKNKIMTLSEFKGFISYFEQNINLFADVTTIAIWRFNLSIAFVNCSEKDKEEVAELKSKIDLDKKLKLQK
jgi:hypothetical protein